MLLRICNRWILPRRKPKPYFLQQWRERSGRGELIEIDLEGDGVKKVEEMIHRMDVLKSTPEWLPFLPGSSFWVPPPSSPSRNLAQALLKMANPDRYALSQDQSLSLTTLQGWPSSHFFQGQCDLHSYLMRKEGKEGEVEWRKLKHVNMILYRAEPM